MDLYAGIISTNIIFIFMCFIYGCLYLGPFVVGGLAYYYYKQTKLEKSPSATVCPECQLEMVEIHDGYKAECLGCGHRFKYIGEPNYAALAAKKRTLIAFGVVVFVDVVYMILLFTA